MSEKPPRRIPLRPPARPADGATRVASPGESPRSAPGIFEAGTAVRVTRVRSQSVTNGRSGELGAGSLLDPLAVGRPLRVNLEGDAPALVTSPVRGVERIGPGTVQVVTANSVYRLKVGDASRTGPPASAPSVRVAPAASPRRPRMPGRRERLAELRARAQQALSDSTCFVSPSELPQPGGSPFDPGARVRVLRRKLADPTAEFETAGTGRILDRLEAGEPARLGLEGGPTFVTSPVRRLRLIDARCVELETLNTLYRLERV